jgi:PEP-CTERM motif
MIRVMRSMVALAALAVAVAAPPPVRAGGITIINTVVSDGYRFVNFDGPGAGASAAAGTNMNGIANNGTVVGFGIADNQNLTNFTANPLTSTSANVLSSLASNAMALGVNSAGSVVGGDGAGNAFIISGGGSPVSFLPGASTMATAFGINDGGAISGTMTTSAGSPGFVLNGDNLITINAPNGATNNVVNAQGINNNGLVVGFYLGNDGVNVHAFMGNVSSAVGGVLTGTAIADPTIPPVNGEPGATFEFSQMLSINDHGIAVGYYGDSTLSQHGYFYNTMTGKYTFLDDPDAAFSGGVEVTQITGINNSGEITGFYSDANGVFHGFVATSVPEPGSLALMCLGVGSLVGVGFTRMRRPKAAS